jgi:hypothetical protein
LQGDLSVGGSVNRVGVRVNAGVGTTERTLGAEGYSNVLIRVRGDARNDVFSDTHVATCAGDLLGDLLSELFNVCDVSFLHRQRVKVCLRMHRYRAFAHVIFCQKAHIKALFCRCQPRFCREAAC